MSGIRRPKATKLKEAAQKERSSGFEMTKFLGRAAQMMVVLGADDALGEQLNDPALFEKSQTANPYKTSDDKTHNIHLVETQAGTQEFSKTMPLPNLDRTNPIGISLPASKPKKQSSIKWIDPTFQKEIGTKVVAKPKPEPKSNLGPALLLAGALGLVGYVAFAPSGPGAAVVSKMTPKQLQERIEFHRKTTGWRLNNERIETQIDNHYQAPNIPFNAQKVKPQDMMKGLPLGSEANIGANAPEKTLPVNPSYADARIMYGLQEEQDNLAAEKLAKQIYVQEFIQNAAADGYKISVDKDGNILEASKSSNGYNRGPGNVLEGTGE